MTLRREPLTKIGPSIVDAITSQLIAVFDVRAIQAFRGFLAHHNHKRRWIITSDYNWRDKTRPQDVLAFSIFPDDGDLPNLVRQLSYCFPADFKNTTQILERGTGFFHRTSAAFHVCIILDKKGSILQRDDFTQREVARESIGATREYLEQRTAPIWIIERLRRFERMSGAKNFNMNLYNDILVLSSCYTVLIGLLVREAPIERVLWCSDRDDRTVWADGILDTYSLLNSVRFASSLGSQLDAQNLPRLVLRPTGTDEFDALIRPPDYLAGALASWCLKRGAGTQGASKYGQVLRDAIAGNSQVVNIHLRLDTLIHAKQILVFKTESP